MKSKNRYEEKYRPNFSWAFFLSGILISLFIGGGIRTIYLSEKNANEIVFKALTVAFPAHHVEVEGSNFDLSSFLLPKLSVSIKQLSLMPVDLCRNSISIHLESINLPVSFIKSLSEKKLIIESLIAKRIGVEAAIQTCKNEEKKTAKSNFLKKNTISNQVTTSDLKSIEIQEIQITQDDKILKLSDFIADKNSKDIEYSFFLDASRYTLDLHELKPVRVFGSFIDGEFKFNMSGRFKEGSFSLNGNYAESEFKTKAKVFNIPITQGGFARHLPKGLDFSSVSLWLDCDIDYKLNQKSIETLKSNNCLLKTTNSKLHLKELVLNKVKNKLIHQPFEVDLVNIKVEDLFKVLRVTGLSGVFSDFGTMNGSLSVNKDEDWVLNYNISNSKLYFSKHGVPGFQKVNFLRGKVSQDAGRLSGLIDEIDFDGGEFQGKFDFNFNEDLTSGLTQIQITKVVFSPSIQKLLVGKNLGPLSVFGKGIINGKNISKWEGEIKVEDLETHFLRIEKLKLTPLFKDKKIVSEILAQSIVAHNSKSKFSQEIKKISQLEDLEFENVKGTAIISNKQSSLVLKDNAGLSGWRLGAERNDYQWAVGVFKGGVKKLDLKVKEDNFVLYNPADATYQFKGSFTAETPSRLNRLKELGKRAFSRDKNKD